MNLFKRNMGLTYTIFAGFLQIAAIIFGVLAYTADQKENKVKTAENTFNINGDFVNGDKKSSMNLESVVKKEKTQVVKRASIKKGDIIEKGKLQEVKQEKKTDDNKTPTVNNGIVNLGVNYGNQTVNNNYNEKEAARQFTNNDLQNIKYNIPLDYKIDISFVNSTEECLNFTNQIITGLTQFGYKIANINSIGMLIDGRINKPGDRFYIKKDESQKTAEIVIKEQK